MITTEREKRGQAKIFSNSKDYGNSESSLSVKQKTNNLFENLSPLSAQLHRDVCALTDPEGDFNLADTFAIISLRT